MTVYTYEVKVQSVSSSNKFFIDGYQQPSLALGHDITYRFDVSDSSNAGHVFQFSTTSDGTHGGGTALGSSDGYTTSGTAGSANAYVELDVTSSTASTLYYFCGSSGHTGMGGTAVTTSAEYVSASNVALRKPILGNSDSWGHYINQNLDTIAGKLPASFVFPTGTGDNNQVILSNGSGGTSWGDVALTPEIQGVTWYSDSGYSSTLSASEAINIDDATYLKITGLNFGSSGVFGGTSYVQIINTTQSNAVVGNNQSGLTGCVTSASHQSDTEVRLTVNPSGVSGISSGDTLKVKIVTAGGESLFATGYVVSADPTSVTTVNSATISNTASVGSFGGTVTGGGEDSNTKLLLHFDRNGGTDTEDSSNTGGHGHASYTNGNASIKSSPFGDGKSAMFFDGSDDVLTIPDSDDWDLGVGPWTIELWAYHDSSQTTGYQSLIKSRNSTGGWELKYHADNDKLIWFDTENGTGEIATYTGAGLDDKWVHIAYVKLDGTTDADKFKLFLNGKEVVSTSRGGTAINRGNSNPPLKIGTEHNEGTNNFWKGYLDEIRIVKGSAVYTGDFTVPTSRLTKNWSGLGTNITDYASGDNVKLLIHSDIDHVVNQSMTIAGVSDTPTAHGSYPTDAIRFDNGSGEGSNDHQMVVNGIDPGIWDDDWTLEGWFWQDADNDSSNGQTLFSTKDLYFGVMLNGTTNLDAGRDNIRIYTGNGTWQENGISQSLSGAGITWNTNEWHHFAIVKDGNNIGTFIDGRPLGSHSQGGNYPSYASVIDYFQVGVWGKSTGAHRWNGKVNGIRLSKVARYTLASASSTAQFTPETTFHTRDANTAVLVSGTELAFKDSATGTGFTTHSITPTGAFHSTGHGGIAPAMTWPASLKKTGSAGIYFDGDADGLKIFNTPHVGTNVHTIDFWLWYSGTQNGGSESVTLNSVTKTVQSVILDLRKDHNGNSSIWIYVDDSNQIGVAKATEDYFLPSASASALTLNTWQHICVVRKSGHEWELYIDGVRKLSQTYEVNLTQNSTGSTDGSTYFWLGSKHGANTSELTGYIDSFRYIFSDETASGGSLYHITDGQITVPTKIYGAFKSDTIDTITLTGTAGTGGGYVTFNNATLSGQTETTSALPAGLTLNEAESTDNTATITGDLTASAGQHAINLVARATSDGTNANIDPNRKQAYSHTIDKGSGGTPVLFNARRYMGNATARDISGLGFQPDLVWLKSRDVAHWHALYDSVRGAENVIYPNENSAEGSATTGLKSFNSDGFRVGVDNNINQTDKAKISWAFKAGGANTTNGKKIVDGTVSDFTIASGDLGTSTDGSGHVGENWGVMRQSVSQTSGFSITRFQLQTSGDPSSTDFGWFKHNLSSATNDNPDMIIFKRLDGTGHWYVWHSGMGAWSDSTTTGEFNQLFLQTDDAKGSAHHPPRFRKSTSYGPPTNDGKIWVDRNAIYEGDGQDEFICYAWKSMVGVSAFGTHTGQISSVSGTTVGANGYCGFKPRWLMIKCISHAGSWFVVDAFRGEASAGQMYYFETQGGGTESSDPNLTASLTSTGFTTGTHNSVGGSGRTYISIAFA